MAVKDSPCRECGVLMWRKSKSAPVGAGKCKPCGSRCGTVGGYGRGCRCGECRAAKASSMRAYAAKRRVRDGVAPTTALRRARRGVDPALRPPCYVCGELMSIVRDADNERPMHRECRWLIPGWQRRPGGTSPARRRFMERAAKAAAGRPATARVFVQGPCDWCGESFCAPDGRYCSSPCRRRAGESRRRPFRFNPKPRLRLEVYERDGWVCGLCDLPIDKSLKWPHKWSASLDHVVPQSLVLIPDHSAQNLRAVHLQCNAMRGDGSNMSEDELRRRAFVEIGGGGLVAC